MTSLTIRIRLLISCILSLAAGIARGQVAPPEASGQAYNVRAFGATGDGKTLDTDAINRAVEAAAAAGGGTVQIPAGRYLSFSIRLKSHVDLHLDQGCILVAAREAPGYGAYDAAEPNEWGDKYQYQNFGHSHFHNSLIWGDGLEDVSITGSGLIDGRALPRSNGEGERPPGGKAAPGGDFAGLPPLPPVAPPPASAGFSARGRGGNKVIALVNCRNVIVRDLSVLQAGWFALLATGVDNLTVDNVKVDTNRDGFNFDSCRNVRVSNCTVNAINDDGICLKSSYALGTPRACENITITGCQVSGFDPGSFFDGTYKTTQEHAIDRDGPTGRIKFGTESEGGFRNITIANCVFDHCRGFALEMVDGGTIEDVAITNIAMHDICNSAIFIRLGNRARGPAGTPVGAIRRVTISHVVASDVDGRYPILIAGLPGHPIEDVRLSDIRIICRGGVTLNDAATQPAGLANRFFIRGNGLDGPRDPYLPPEQEKAYPEPSMFGILPAYGVYARHAAGLSLRDVELGFVRDDTRPAIVLDDVSGAELDHVEARRAGGAPSIVLRKVSDFSVVNSPGVPDRRMQGAEQESL